MVAWLDRQGERGNKRAKWGREHEDDGFKESGRFDSLLLFFITPSCSVQAHFASEEMQSPSRVVMPDGLTCCGAVGDSGVEADVGR